MTGFTLAAAQYPIDAFTSFAEWEDKQHRWAAEAKQAGASLLLYPEYAPMELTSIDARARDDLSWSLHWMADQRERIDAVHATLAAEFGVHICAGSCPTRRVDGDFANVARLFAPNGQRGEQAKQVMTRFEREEWHVAGNDGQLSLFVTALGPIGIAICYDVEFPLIARALVEAGAKLILTPSATDSHHGYWRVRVGAQARALENQCYVAQAPTVGDAPWCASLDINRGAAGVFGPSDMGFPADGVVALGRMDAAQWLFTEIDLSLVDAVRSGGAVFNHRHWAEQPGAPPFLAPVNRIDLSAG